MAQLKDLLVSGPSRLVGDVFTNKIQATQLFAPTAAGGSTYGAGTNGQVLKTNGTSIYWGADTNSMTGVKGNAESSYRTGNVNLTQSNIIGSSAIGSTTRPIYYTGAAFSGTTATVGSTTRPIYMNAGVLSGTTATVGGTTRPVYLNAGVISGTTATVGAANKPIYMSGGVLTATASTIGGASQIMYMSGGVLTAGTTLGSFATRNSLNWGEITQSGANNIDEGSSDFTDNTEIFSSYASNNGFADTNAVGKVYRRDAIKMYNYISGKLALGTAAKVASGTFSLSGHTHNISLASGGTSTITLAYDTAYSLTAGGKTVVFKMPATDNTNTTYSFASGNGQFTYTPSNGSATIVSIGKPSTAGTADKLGSSNVGTNTKFIYLESGTPKASTANVGGATTPIYISGGVLTAGTALGTAAYTNSSAYAAASHGTHVSYGTSATAISSASGAGSASTVSRSDHVHNIVVGTGDENGQVKIAGQNASVKGLGTAAYTASGAYAAASHGTHVTYGTSATAISSASGAGTAATLSRSDHVHNIVVGTGDENGQVKIAGQNASVKGLGTAAYTASGTYAAASHGTHVTYGTSATAISSASGAGSATTLSRSDHVHNIVVGTGDNNGQVKIAGQNASVKGLGTAAYTASGTYATSGHTHAYIVTEGDNRSTATTPNDYANKIIYRGLKTNTAIGSPSSDSYSYLIGLRGWSDSSGGNSHELAFNNTGIFSRNGATTSWGNWTRIPHTNNTTGQVGSATQPVYVSSGAITACSGTLVVNVTGNAGTASKLTNITTSDAASSTTTWRRVWFSYNDNVTGRPAYDDTLAYQSSTKTLRAGKFYAEHQSGGGNEFRVTYGSTVDMALMIGSGDANHGLYDTKASKWMIYADTNGNVTVNGNATTATTASKLGASNVGASDRPIYLSSGTATQTTYRMAATNTSATGAVAISGNLVTGIWYVNGTNSTDLYSIADGAAYVNKYNDSWLHEIYGDYRTGQIAVRGKNNGTWQAWRKVLDSSNYNTWASPKAGSTDITTLGTITTGTWNGTAIGSGYIATLPISKISGLGTAAQVASGTFSLSGHTHSYYPKWQTTSTTTDNTLYDYGVYVKQGGATVSPTGSAYFSILNIPYRKAAGNTKADYAWSLGNSTGNDKRLFFRTSNADNYSSWQEVAHGEAGTAVGSATLPVYMTSSGVITACSGTLAINISGNAANVTGTVTVGHGGTGSTTAAGARANLGTWALISDSYNTFMPADGTTNGWYKFGTSNTSYGILPSAAGGAGSGHNYIGTSSWYWKYAYIDQIYGYLNGNISGSAAKLGTANKGSTVKGIYLSSGAPAEMTYSLYATVNSGSSATNKLAYYSGNNAVSTYTSTVGSHTKGMWLNGGVPTAMSGTVGTAKRPVYLSSGTVTAVNWAGTSLPANNAGVNGDIFFLRL